MNILPSTIVMNENTILKHGDSPLRLEQDRLPYDININVIDPLYILEDGYNFSYSGFDIYFKRNSIGVLSGGFFLPTGLFSVLSLVSFCIHYENVRLSVTCHQVTVLA